MGHSYASITVYNKEHTKSEIISLLADTGSTYTWIRKETLEKLGLVPEIKRKFRTIEGRSIEREVGEAVVEYADMRATTKIVFAIEEDGEVLGVHALEGLGLEVDPVTKELKKAEVLLAV